MSLAEVAARAAVPPFHAMRVFEAAQARAAGGLPMFNLAAGQPGTPAPAAVRARAVDTVSRELIGYTSALAAHRCARRSPGTTGARTASMSPLTT
jgi:hypothetical protein